MPSVLSASIPASQLVDVIPSVLSAGGAGLQFNGFVVDANLTSNGYPVLPMGTVYNFADKTDIENYFGATSQEAGLGDIYFTGPTNATVQPVALLFAQYAINAVPGFLRGGSISGNGLSAIQAISSETLTISIDGSPITQSITLSSATSFSNAANLLGAQLAIKGISAGSVTATLAATSPHMNVTAIIQGPQRAQVTASLNGTTMTVTAILSGNLGIGDVVTGTGITAGTTIASYNGAGQPGGIGSYTLSASATTEPAETITAYAPAPTIQIGQVVTGVGITTNTYISGFGSGTGGIGTYILSTAPSVESSETIQIFAPGVTYNSNLGCFDVRSGTSGASSSVGFGSGAAAAPLGLSAGAGAVQSLGAAASTPAAFMTNVVGITQNWVEFMTTWEPVDADKEAFATWNNGQDDSYVYTCWETDPLDTEQNAGSALANFLQSGNVSGTNLLWTNPAITTLAGEKAAFQLSWTACLNFNALNGRQTAAGKSYAGGLADVTSGTVALTLAGKGSSYGYGVNFYGNYATRNQAFIQWQRGLISGPFQWKDSYVDEIWLNNNLQLGIMSGLTSANSVPYNTLGNATIESWCMPAITAAVNFGAIVAGVTLSAAQIQEVNTQAGIAIDQVLFNRGWYLQVLANTATSQTRASRSSPPCTLWYCDGGQVQAINLASIEIQ